MEVVHSIVMPHAIRVDPGGDLLDELDGDAMWLTSQPRNEPNFVPGWLIKVDRATGRLIGYVPSEGGHGVARDRQGDLLLGPGPGGKPARYGQVR